MTERHDLADLVTKAEAADLLRVSPRTIERYVSDGHLAPLHLPSGHVRFERATVLALLSTPTVEATS